MACFVVVFLRLGDPKLVKDKKETPFLRETDIGIFLDGRNPANLKTMKADLVRYKKASELLSKTQGLVTVRLMFKEVALARKTCLTETAPDPLENMLVLQPKAYKQQLPQRALPEFATDNFSRAWLGLTVRDASDMELATVTTDDVPVPPKKKAAAEASAAQESAPDPAPVDDKSDNEDADSASEAQETWTPDAGTLLFPWEASEAFWGSVLQGFHLRFPSTTCLIDFTPGSGVAALAAVRGRYRYTGYAATATHEKFLRQYVMYKIVTEMILNIDATSWNTKKRILSRESSLTGGESESCVTEKVSPSVPEKKLKTKSSSSSESSSES